MTVNTPTQSSHSPLAAEWPSVSVVICAYTERRWDELCRAVHSAQTQTPRPLEVIVVVDHNADLFMRTRCEIKNVFVVENNHQQGLSGARNTGVGLASGEVIAFLDDDAVAAPDWLEHLLVPYLDADVIGVGGAIQPSWTGERPAWFPDEFLWVVGCTYRGLPTTRSPIRNLIGANMSFRREAFVGLEFRAGLGRIGTVPLGGEETDFCIRLSERHPGAKIVYEPSATVMHTVTTVRSRWQYFTSRCHAEGLSKATISKLVGRKNGLRSEQAHVLKTLPLGVWRGLRVAVTQGEMRGLAQAGAIIAGLVATVFGYVSGLVRASP